MEQSMLTIDDVSLPTIQQRPGYIYVFKSKCSEEPDLKKHTFEFVEEIKYFDSPSLSRVLKSLEFEATVLAISQFGAREVDILKQTPQYVH